MDRPKSEPKNRPVRMRDVAAVAGVDTSVVSRVLSGDERLLVRPETRQRVLDAIERLGYQPHPAARMLKTSRAMALGMVVPDFSNAAYAEIARGADERARELGYAFLVANGTIQDRLPILRGRVDGLLYAIATSEPTAPTRLPEGLPSLLINRREPGLGPSIVVDDEASARIATEHLIGLGHKRIGHLVGKVAVDTGRRRTAGYANAMNAAGIPVAPELTVEAEFDEEGGYQATLQLLGRPDPPTAIFVAMARWAIGALAACDELGVRVPQDLSVVSFSDIPIAPYMRPALTAIRLPLMTMGNQAVDMLLRIIEGEEVEDVMVEGRPELAVRDSTAPPRA